MLLSALWKSAKVEPRRVFRYPLVSVPRMAVCCESLQVPKGVLQCSSVLLPDLETLGLQTIAAPAALLAGANFRRWRPTHPIVVFTGVHHGFLYDYLRNRIWAELGVPAFEYLLDSDGRRLATECEAHSGLHVEAGLECSLDRRGLAVDGVRSGLTCELIKTLCGCAQRGVRLCNVRLAPMSTSAAPASALVRAAGD